AFAEYQRILQSDPGNRAAVRGTAALYEAGSQLDEALTWHRRLVSLDPANADAPPSLSAAACRPVADAGPDAGARAGLPPDDRGPIADPALRQELRTRWTAAIDAGIADATKALTIDPEHDGAMTALSGWHRVRAEVADSADTWQRETRTADDLMR